MIGSTVPSRFLPRPSPVLQPIFLIRNSPTPPDTGAALRNWSWETKQKTQLEKEEEDKGEDSDKERLMILSGNKGEIAH